MSSKKKIVITVPLSTVAVGSLITFFLTVLKFLGYISWPWWLVIAPLWFPTAMSCFFVLLAFLGVAFISFLAWILNR